LLALLVWYVLLSATLLSSLTSSQVPSDSISLHTCNIGRDSRHQLHGR
jgi:hypothetical protein